jgi:hypothetical protein
MFPLNLSEEERNKLDVIEFCDRAAKAWEHKSSCKEILQLKCWDKQEADEVKQRMAQYYPHVKFFVSWLDFTKGDNYAER